MRIAYDNMLDTAALSTNYPSTNYPLSNIADKRLSRIYKSTSGINLTITIQGTAAFAASCLFIANHNIGTGAMVKIQGNSTDSWSAPAFERTVSINGPIITKFWSDADENLYVVDDLGRNVVDEHGNRVLVSQMQYQYWRILINDPSNLGVKIGGVFLGEFVILPNRLIGNRVRDYDTSQYKLSRSNQVYGTAAHRYRTITAAFPGQLVDSAARYKLREIWGIVGAITPFYVTSFCDQPGIEAPMYAKFDDDNLNWAESPNSATNWEIDVTFREVA